MSEPLRHNRWANIPPVAPPVPRQKPKPRVPDDQAAIERLTLQAQVAEDAIRRIELLAFDARRRIDEMRRRAA